jgi:hypothetical protein
MGNSNTKPEENKQNSDSEIDITLTEENKKKDDISTVFYKSNSSQIRTKESPPEVISIHLSDSESNTISATSPVTRKQEKEMKNIRDNTTSDSDNTISATSTVDYKQKKEMDNIRNNTSSDSDKVGGGSFTESEINIKIVPLMNGGSKNKNYKYSESSPFITSEAFKEILENNGQNGGSQINESEFDSNKLLNIIMQMGGETKSDSDSDDKDSDDEDSDDKDSDEDEDEDDDEDDEDDDLFADSESTEAKKLERSKKAKKTKRLTATSSMSRSTTPDSSSSSSSSDSDDSSSSSDSDKSSSSSNSDDSSSSSSSNKILSNSSISLAIPRRINSLVDSVSSDSVYIMSSDSSIGSRDINLLSFDEPVNNAWDKKKSKKSKKY